MIISSLTVTIHQVIYDKYYRPIELRIVVETGSGKKYSLIKILMPDDLRDRFSVIWEWAGRMIKDNLEKIVLEDKT